MIKSIIYKKHATTITNNKSSILARLKNKYDTLRDEDRVKKNEYSRNWYNDLPDDKKNRIREECRNKYNTV